MFSEFLSHDIDHGSVCEEMLLDRLAHGQTAILKAMRDSITIAQEVHLPKGEVLVKAKELIFSPGSIDVPPVN